VPEAVTPQGELPLPAAAPAAAPAPKRFELPPDPVAPQAPAAPVAAENDQVVQKKEEQAPSTEPEVKPEEEVTPEQAAKREGRRFERRLDKAYRQRAEAQARAELLEKQLSEARQASQPKAPQGAPTLEQFDYDPEKYAAAKAEHAKSEAAKEFEAKQRETSEQQTRQKLLTAWEEKVTQADEKYEDFQEKVGELQPNSPFAYAIMEAENGADVAYYLGTHPKEAQRIAQLHPLSQAREIGKLEAKLLSTPEKPKAPSKAPAPIAPLAGTQAVVTDTPKESDDMATWIRRRNKQVHSR